MTPAAPRTRTERMSPGVSDLSGGATDAYPVKDFVIDLIAANEAPIPVALLVETASGFGYTEGSVRVCLSRLVASGTLEVIEQERVSRYGFTRGADRFNRRIREQVYFNPRQEPWSGHWRVVAFSCAADRRDVRQRFLYVLERLHFRSLHRGIWIRPDNVELDLEEGLAEFRKIGTADLFSGPPDPASDLEARALELWGIAALAGEMRRFLGELDESRERVRGLGRSEALVETLRTAARSFRLLARDPLLPLEVLPADWPGERLRQMLVDYTDLACDIWADVAQARPARPLRDRVPVLPATGTRNG